MKKRLFWCCFGFCILWTAFIFSRSLKSGAESSAESGAVLALLGRFLDGIGISWLPSEHFLRKLGHFLEYFVLGMLAVPSAKLFFCRFTHHFAWGYTAIVALLDELLMQNLSVGRGPSIFDVLIDTAGALAAILFLLTIRLLLKKQRRV